MYLGASGGNAFLCLFLCGVHDPHLFEACLLSFYLPSRGSAKELQRSICYCFFPLFSHVQASTYLAGNTSMDQHSLSSAIEHHPVQTVYFPRIREAGGLWQCFQAGCLQHLILQKIQLRPDSPVWLPESLCYSSKWPTEVCGIQTYTHTPTYL